MIAMWDEKVISFGQKRSASCGRSGAILSWD